MLLKTLKTRYPKNVSAMVIAERRYRKAIKRAKKANGGHLKRNKSIF